MSIELLMLSNHLILCHLFSCLQSFPASGSFPMSQLFASGGLNIGASASVSVLPMNIEHWFPLGLTGLILLSKGLSKVFSNTMVQKTLHRSQKNKKISWFSLLAFFFSDLGMLEQSDFYKNIQYFAKCPITQCRSETISSCINADSRNIFCKMFLGMKNAE